MLQSNYTYCKIFLFNHYLADNKSVSIIHASYDHGLLGKLLLTAYLREQARPVIILGNSSSAL